MSDSLRDQLLGLGFKATTRPAQKTGQPDAGRRSDARGGHVPAANKPAAKKPTAKKPTAKSPAPTSKKSTPKATHAGDAKRARERSGEIDLARAYAIRAQREKAERIQAEREKQQAAYQRREAKAKLAQFLQGKALNAPDAEIARHFSYGGKIKRVYVTADQLLQLNAGKLGVVQLNGGYLLVDVAILEQAEAIFAPAIALKVDPDAASQEEVDADPSVQVPDDLVW